MASATEATAGQEQQPAAQQEQPKALVVPDNRPYEIQKFELQQRSARLFAMSGLFADIKGQTPEQSIAQAFVKISLGDAMGFNPAESMTGIDLIQGRVAVGSSLRAARMQRAGYSWDILQLDDKGCRLRLKFKADYLMCEEVDGKTGDTRQVPVIVSFMVEDAARAGLIAKDNYKKNPRNMFFARAITNAQRWFAPGILGVDILSTEEAIDMAPLIDPEQAKSERVKAGTDLKADRILQKYSPAAQTAAIDASDLGITDRDTEEDTASQVGSTAQTSEKQSASSPLAQEVHGGTDPHEPPEAGSTPAPAAQSQPQTKQTGRTGHKVHGVAGIFDKD